MKLSLQSNGTSTKLIVSSQFKRVRRRVPLSRGETEKIIAAKNPRVVDRIDTLIKQLAWIENACILTRKDPTSRHNPEKIKERTAITRDLKQRLLPDSKQPTSHTFNLVSVHPGTDLINHAYFIRIIADLREQSFRQGMLTAKLVFPRMQQHFPDWKHNIRFSHAEFAALLDEPDGDDDISTIFDTEPYRTKLDVAIRNAIRKAEHKMMNEVRPWVEIYDDPDGDYGEAPVSADDPARVRAATRELTRRMTAHHENTTPPTQPR